jgi:PKD repeat protein
MHIAPRASSRRNYRLPVTLIALASLVCLAMCLHTPNRFTGPTISTAGASRASNPSERSQLNPAPVPEARVDSQAVMHDGNKQTRIAEAYGNLPLSFEVNEGQAESDVKFLSLGNGYSLSLTSTEAIFTLNKSSAPVTREDSFANHKSVEPQETRSLRTTVRMKLAGANPAPQIKGLEELPGKSNYLIGNDPQKWRTNLSNYAKVEYEGVYPGINLTYYGNQRELEYDFVVSPGADPDHIRLAFEEPDKVRIDDDGELVLRAAGEEIRQHRPLVYQEMSGHRQLVSGRYVFKGEGQVGFEIAGYDASKPLVIDPVLVYSTYWGEGYGLSRAIAIDPAGNVYVAGGNSGAGSYELGNVFITKVNAEGTAFVYSTHLGGSGGDSGHAIALDSSGDIYVAGRTTSTDFPTKNPVQAANAGSFDIFITKLDATGSALIYSTYLGGPQDDSAEGIAVDSHGNAYAVGAINKVFNTFKSPGGADDSKPVTPVPTSSPLLEDSFMTKLSGTGSLVSSTYFNGKASPVSVAIDPADNIYLAGSTEVADFPTVNAIQPVFNGDVDGFVIKYNAAGSVLYATYLGGNGNDSAAAIATDPAGNAYITGYTETPSGVTNTFPTVNAIQTLAHGHSDGFVTKLNATGSAFVYSTFLGGSASDLALAIAADVKGNAYITGQTSSLDFPTRDPFQPQINDIIVDGQDMQCDAFITKLDAAGALDYSSYLGGLYYDYGEGLVADAAGNAYLTGITASYDFPLVNPLRQDGGMFITKIRPGPSITASPSPSSSPTPTVPPDEPYVTSIHAQYPGVFLDGSNIENLLLATVNWRGSPGTVSFSINNGPPIIEQGQAAGVSHSFNMGRDFKGSLSPSEVKLVPTNSAKKVGPPAFQQVCVVPFPSWLNLAFTSNSNALQITAGNGDVTAVIHDEFPKPHLAKNGPIDIPTWVPLIGGKLGMTETFATFDANISSKKGSGRLSLSGQTGFTAVGQSINGRASGSGTFSFNCGRGLELQAASFHLNLNGTIKREMGVIDAIPPLRGLESIPVLGGVVKKFNKTAMVVGEISPALDFFANFTQNSAGNLHFSDGTGDLNLQTTLTLDVPINDHLHGALWIGGGGEIKLGVPEPFVRKLRANLEAGARLTVSGLWLLDGDHTLKAQFHCTWTPDSGTKCGGGSDSSAANNPYAFSFKHRSQTAKEKTDSLTLIQPDYGRYGAYAMFAPQQIAKKSSSVVPVSVEETTITSNIFSNASPSIVEANGVKLLLWVQQDPALPVPQSTDIAWSYNDGSGRWSTPVSINHDTQSELSPVAGLDGNGKVVAAWLRIKDQSFNTAITTAADLPLFYKRLEVVSAVFDPASKTWGAIKKLTDDDAFDTSLRLNTDNQGHLLLTWLSNAGGEFLSTPASPSTLKYSFWNGTEWNTPAIVADGLVGVSEQTAAVHGTKANIILSRDPDSSLSGDSVLDLYNWNGSNWNAMPAFAAGGVDNANPTSIYDAAGEHHIVWLRGSDLVHATQGNPLPQLLRASSASAAFYSMRLMTNPQGNMTLVWEETASDGIAHIFATLYDPTSKTWSADRQLNQETSRLAHDAAGYYGKDGILHLAYLSTEILRASKSVVIEGEYQTINNVPREGQTDLRVLDHTLVVDLAITDHDVSLNPETPQAGEGVTATLDIHNAGDFPVNNFAVSLYSGDPNSNGALLRTLTISEALRGGDHRVVTFPAFTMPATNANIIAIVDAGNNIVEVTKANNRATVYLNNTAPQPDLKANTVSGTAPLAVSFDASASTDAEGDAISFLWAFADDSSSESGSKVTHLFYQAGSYPVTLLVTDAHGAVSTAFVMINVAAPATPVLGFGSAGYQASEADTGAVITVIRSGDASGAATVDYSTGDGTAKQRTDYTIANGTLSFAPGETSKTFAILLTDNAFPDNSRTVNLGLSNPTGGILGQQGTALLTITDNDISQPTTNPIDDAHFFVRQQYEDFLNRAPDSGGLGYWSNEIARCGADANCIHDRRVGVADAFFFEAEFQQTGAYVYRIYKAATGLRPTFSQFISDRGRVVVGTNLEQSKTTFALAFVQRDAFLALYPRSMAADQFVDAMLNTIKANSGVNISAGRNAWIALYDGTDAGRAAILRQMADNQLLIDAEYNRSFVLMEYFGYLKRDPDPGGFNFWLGQVNKFPLRNIAIQHAMACSFITSAEYQTRFSPVTTHTNRECPQ